MIYSSFSSNKIAMDITSLCLTILHQTKQSWKMVHSLLSMSEEKILDIYCKIVRSKEISHTLFIGEKIISIHKDEIKTSHHLLEKALSEGWNVSFFNSPFYPHSWRNLKQPPPLIFFKGLCESDKPGVAVVGTTQPDEISMHYAQEVVMFLIQSGGYHISGGARGIDQIGHETAIQSGGTTQVILPCGIFQFPIPNNWEEAIAHNKMQIISPWLPHAPWETHQAVRRNVLIASLAGMGCIFQPSHEGGSLSVARHLLSRNLPVFVYNPRGYASLLQYLPKVIPLVEPDGKLNYPQLTQALIQVKNYQEKQSDELFH